LLNVDPTVFVEDFLPRQRLYASHIRFAANHVANPMKETLALAVKLCLRSKAPTCFSEAQWAVFCLTTGAERAVIVALTADEWRMWPFALRA
jgi:hypothetical protein